VKHNKYTIFAIDPGCMESAVVVWDGEKILDHYKMENHIVLKRLKYLAATTPVYIEMIASYGMPVGAEVFDTCVWIGRFIQALKENRPEGMMTSSPIGTVFRKDIKMFLCGSSRAKDSNIRTALIDLYGKPGTKKAPGVTYGLKNDTWAAFAVAVYCHGMGPENCILLNYDNIIKINEP
jgi:hypothetical protein